MRDLLTTQSQNSYREQIKKEMLTRLTWRSRYAKLYPSCYNPWNNSKEPTQLPQLPKIPADPQTLYLHRRGHIKPEEKFNFPLLSSWDYGWRLGTMETPSSARSSLVKNTFYAKNGVFSRPAATDTLG
uniref:Si:ch211-193l2.10 n=1 Tax=Neolamprologus brichardi TaxID=32507 RepID=A0A3Q4HC77_NEOBR